MTHGTIIFDERVSWPATLALVTLLASICGIVYWMLQPQRQAEPSPSVDRPVSAPPPVSRPLLVTPRSSPATVSSPEGPRVSAVRVATQPAQNGAPGPADMPYRFIGKVGAGAETSILLFGRGRIASLRGPTPLDDEYVVDAVFDDYIVIRHVPTGVGQFLALAQRRQVTGPSMDPEDSPRD